MRCNKCGHSAASVSDRCGVRLSGDEWCDGTIVLDRAATIEAAARKLLEALPRCSVPTCGKSSVVNARIDGRTEINSGPAYRQWLCFDCYEMRMRHSSEIVAAPWADAAAKLAAELEE